ncbi:MAG: hypothetical protein ACREPG_07205, partial [Candidatus Binatia bacterium]
MQFEADPSCGGKRARGAKEDNGGRVFNPPTPRFEKFARDAQTFMDSNTKSTKVKNANIRV